MWIWTATFVNKRWLRCFQICTFEWAYAEIISMKWKKEWLSSFLLQNLLQHPELSNSQLLADFLSPHSTESQFLDRMLPDVNLGTVRVCQCDGLCWAGETQRGALCRDVCATWPWLSVRRLWWWIVRKPFITEIKYLCFTGKIIKSVPSKLIKEVRNTPGVCVWSVCARMHWVVWSLSDSEMFY